VGVGGRAEGEIAEGQGRGRDLEAGRDLGGGDCRAFVLEAADQGQAADLHGREAVRAGVVGVREAEVGGGEGVGAVFEDRDRVVGAGGGVVDGGDVDGDGVGRRVEVVAAVGGAAVVADLEGEGRVGGAVGVGGRAEGE